MPIEEPKSVPADQTSEETESTKTVDLDASKEKTEPKTVKFTKKKLIFCIVIGFLLLTVVGIGAYVWGQNNTPAPTVTKEEVKQKSTENSETVEVGLGEEGTAKNGIAIKLEEAKIDQTYEKQKQESKQAVQKNSSNSAYLDSEYYKSSNLLLKISLRNTKDKALGYSQSDFRLKDSDENQYTPSAGYEGSSTPTIYNLNPGETTKLNQAYIVPTSEKNFKLIYQNVVVDFSI